MEKLELKHLAPYLPYDIKIVHGVTRKNLTAVSLDSKFIFTTTYLGSRNKQMLLISDIKPILRPIEYLYSTETDCGIKIVHYFNFKTNVVLDCKNFPYHVMEQLFKNHFDVFDLIDKGLAISYSDVQSTSNEG